MKTILISAAYSDMAKNSIALLQNDCSFVLLGRNKQYLEQVVIDLGLNDKVKLIAECDISNDESCKRVASVLDAEGIKLGGMVNFAGSLPVKANIYELEANQLENDLKTRVIGNVNLVKHFERFLLDKSSIVIINGILSKLPDPDFLCSSISTGAVKNLAKALSKGLANRKIRVNTINPCATETKMKNSLFESLAEKACISASVIEDAVKSKIPMGRLCSTGDIAHVVKFFISSESSFITGTSVDVDGGYNPGV